MRLVYPFSGKEAFGPFSRSAALAEGFGGEASDEEFFRAPELFRLRLYSGRADHGLDLFPGNGNGVEVGEMVPTFRTVSGSPKVVFFNTVEITLSLSVFTESMARRSALRRAIAPSGSPCAFRLVDTMTTKGNPGMTFPMSKSTG